MDRRGRDGSEPLTRMMSAEQAFALLPFVLATINTAESWRCGEAELASRWLRGLVPDSHARQFETKLRQLALRWLARNPELRDTREPSSNSHSSLLAASQWVF